MTDHWSWHKGRYLKVLVCLLLLPAAAGWFGDAIAEVIRQVCQWPCLDKPLTTPECPGQSGWRPSWSWPDTAWLQLAAAVLAAVIFGCAAGALFQLRKSLIRSTARLVRRSDVSQRPVLIVGLSPRHYDKNTSQVTAEDERALRAMHALSLDDLGLDCDAHDQAAQLLSQSDPRRRWLIDLETAKPSGGRIYHPWRQVFRLIGSFATAGSSPQLRRLVVVTSSGPDGSQRDWAAFAELIRLKLGPGVDVINGSPGGIDFEDYDVVFRTLGEIVKRQLTDTIKTDDQLSPRQISHEDICIDATAGFKIFSIAAAMVTMNRDFVFSYVTNSGQSRFYDASVDFASALGEGG